MKELQNQIQVNSQSSVFDFGSKTSISTINYDVISLYELVDTYPVIQPYPISLRSR